MKNRPLLEVDFAESGMDAGSIVYTINVSRVEGLSEHHFTELLETIDAALKRSSTLGGSHHN